MSGLPCVKQKLTLLAAAFLLSLFALFAAFPQVAWAADDDIASGTCGTCVWVIDSEGTLTISPEDGKSGTLESIYDTGGVPWYSDRADIKSVVVDSGVKTGKCCYSLFQGCSKLVSVDVSGLDSSEAIAISDMFNGCQRLKSADLSSLDFSKVERADGLFKSCTLLQSVNLDGVDFSSLTSAYDMFNSCRSLESIDLSLFSGSSLGRMYRMFENCTSLTSVDMSGSSLPKATGMDDMFNGCTGLESVNLSKAAFPKLSSMNSMFESCSSLTSVDFSGLSVRCVDDFGYIFANCGKLKSISLDGLDCDAASSASSMFRNCSSLAEADFSGVKASSIQNAYMMFYGCSNLKTVDLSGIDSLISSCDDMFDGCESLTTIYDDGGLSFLSDEVVFRGCASLRGGNGTAYSRDKASVEYACIDKAGQLGYFTCKHSDLKKVDEVAPGSGSEGASSHYECSVCEKLFEDSLAEKELKSEDLVLHAWGDYSSNGDATCAKDGTKTRTCSVCGKSQTAADEGSKLAHAPGEPESENAKAATCTDDGSHDEVVRCSACGEELSRNTVADPKLGHDETMKTQLKQAGISADGYLETKHVCKRCGLELSSEKSDILAVKNVALSNARFTYSGKQNRPSIKVSDSKGTALKQDADYVVSYQNDGKDVGSHSVTIKGKGNYSFTKSLTFTVNPKGSSLSKVSAAKKAFTAKWSKQTSQTTGYQLRYSTKSSMAGAKTSTVKSTKTTSKKVSKLKKKTKYYVQVRTYKVVKGKTYYSDWSKVKSVKTK